MTNTVRILFVISKARVNHKGLAPISCRLTYKGKRKAFATGFFISPKHWKSKTQIASPPDKHNEYLNTQLSLIKQKINQAFLFLKVNLEHFDVEDIYLHYKGKAVKKEKTLLQVFKIHNDRVEKLIGKEYELPTLWKYKQARALLKGFIVKKYKKNDYQFKDLNFEL